MGTVLVDSCVVSDLADCKSTWFEWSVKTLEQLDQSNQLVINPVIYAEASITFNTIESYQSYIDELGFNLFEIPKEALFLAGKAFLSYRKRKGNKSNVLPDFFIGAHAAVNNYKLVTRDKDRFSTYFPTVELIIPKSQ